MAAGEVGGGPEGDAREAASSDGSAEGLAAAGSAGGASPPGPGVADLPRLAGAVVPLRLLVLGGLLWLVDVSFTSTTNGRGFRFDVLNDAVATAMIVRGLIGLRACWTEPRYRRDLLVCTVVAALATLNALRAHVVAPMPVVVTCLVHVLALAVLACLILFAHTMRRLCLAAQATEAARSFRTTCWLFVGVHAVPLGALHAAHLAALSLDVTVRVELGWFGLPVLVVLLLPLAHLFVSTTRLQQSAYAVAA